MKEINLDKLEILEESVNAGETGFICGSGCLGILCYKTEKGPSIGLICW